MGLSASQARLLTITARKADCEFQSMQLSHQKIALSRDMENVSTEYQQALNQTKLVYDYYGTGTSQMDLTYDLLMKPSIYNDYYPKLITDSQNRVVLDDRYAAAAIYAGIPAEGLNGTSSSEVRDAFIRALAGEGDNGNKVVDKNGKPLDIISETTKDIILKTTYNNGISLGASYSATSSTQNITYAELLDKIEASTYSTEDYGLEQFGGRVTSDVWGDAVQFLNHNRESGDERANGNYSSTDSTFIYKGTKNQNMVNMTNGNSYSLSLADLLKDEEQYTYVIQAGGGQCHPGGDAAFLQKVIIGGEYDKSFLNWMTDQFSSILGGVTQNDLALQYAYNNVYDLIYPNEDIQQLGEKYKIDGVVDKTRHDASNYTKHNRAGRELMNYIGTLVKNCYDCNEVQAVTDKADEYIGCTYSACYHGTKGSQSTIAVNLNNLAKVFLTSYVEYIQGIDISTYNYNIGKLDNANLYKPKDGDIFTINGNSTVSSGSENLLAGFYDALFNQICVSGWTRNDEIGTNKAYLQELMKNGSVFISSINNDGYYYMGNYSTDVYIAEIADTEAIARAEAKYNSEKSKIENKENTIDMKMKNLDTEISSLTTEYDTTKSIITKAIEKSFKRYEA
jgi:hypothetical protein